MSFILVLAVNICCGGVGDGVVGCGGGCGGWSVVWWWLLGLDFNLIISILCTTLALPLCLPSPLGMHTSASWLEWTVDFVSII